MNTYTLTVTNWDGSSDLQKLTPKLEAAVLSSVKSTRAHHITGQEMEVCTFLMDGNMLRNTEAHGLACDQGFVTHTTPVSA